jgi:5-formyltetrahydrofolate cyclo-ligase
MDKQSIRIESLAKRRALKQEAVAQSSRLILNKLLSLKVLKNAKNIMLYWAIDNEVNIADIVKALGPNKKYFLPKILDNIIQPTQFVSEQELVAGKYNVFEPRDIQQNIDIKELDLILVPGVCFDYCGNRLGYGKGYYDNLLAKARGSIIGIAYDWQVYQEIPAEKFDVPVQLIVTDNQIIDCKKQGK